MTGMKAMTMAVKSAWSRLGQHLAKDDADWWLTFLLTVLYFFPHRFEAYMGYVSSHLWAACVLCAIFIVSSVLYAYAAIIRRKRLWSLIWRVWMSIGCIAVACSILFLC